MSALSAPWVKENSATTGTGSLILTGKLEKYIRFNMGFTAGSTVWYSVEDANGNREAGKGTFNGTNQISRDEIDATLVSGVFNNTNPTPINLSGTSVVSCTFNSAAYNALLTSIEQAKTAISTGILFGGKITINALDNTKFDISAGKGVILDISSPQAPQTKIVEWENIEGVTVSNLATSDSTLIAINSLGTVMQSTTSFSYAQSRSLILLGGISHPDNATIATSYGLKMPSYNLGASLRDLTKALGLINEDGNVFSANGANLQINRSEGVVFAYGQNFDDNPNDPNHVTTTLSQGETFLRVHGNNSGGLVVESVTNLVDPNNYDNNGVLTAVPTNRWSNIRLYVYPNTGTNVVRYGSAHYGTKTDALNALLTESVEELTELGTAVLRGFLTVKEGATELDNAALAVFTANNGNISTGNSGTSSTGLAALIDDPNPQLGGDLDTNSFNILMDVGATVDGRDLSVDGAKLDNIEPNAKDDQLASEVPFTSSSGLTATDVNAAIDEVNNNIPDGSAYATAAQGTKADTALQPSDKGVANGVATLDAGGKVPSTQLPSYVDDVVEVATFTALPVTGEADKIYIVVADENEGNKTTTYRWSGAAYALISSSMSAEDIATLYEGLTDTNKYTDADKAIVASSALIAAAMTKVEFDALAEQRKRENAGSGFLEWGNHFPNSVNFVNINEGMTATVTASNANNKNLFIGRNFSDAIGSSRTNYPKALVNGVVITLADIVGSNAISVGIQNAIPFPTAPDGTKTYNSATGAVTQHADATAAFAAETATNKVITSRKDLVLLEMWHEAIDDKDEVYPLGNVQYGATTYEGVTLTVRNDGYTRFGERDNTTIGYKATWSALTTAEKLKFISNPENNIYYDEEVGKFIQARYRVRVIEGAGDDWNVVRPSDPSNSILRYDSNNNARVFPRGSSEIVTDLTNTPTKWFACAGSGLEGADPTDYGSFSSNDRDAANLPYTRVLPIALVQRLNQGAYHPTYNPQGCRAFAKTGVGVVDWYSPFGDGTSPNDYINSTLRCFIDHLDSGDNVGFRYVTGRIGDTEIGGTGRPDQYKFFDAIYAGMVEDLRLNASKLDYSRLLQDSFNKATAATKRGKGKVPFTKVFASVAAVESGYAIVNQDNPAAVVAESYSVLTAEYDELPWVDIVGNPTSIAATFPDGIVGQWIPVSVVGGNSNFNLNRKANASESFWVQTSNSGANFSVGTKTIGQATNTVNFTLITTSVLLIHYEALSNHTKASNRDAVEYANFDTLASSSYLVNNGNRLAGSTVGVIGKVDNENVYQGARRNSVQNKLDSSFKPISIFHNSIDSTPSSGAGTKGIKSTPYLVQKDGLLYMQYLSQELEHDGTDWGDSGFVQIVDGDATYTNDNGVTLKASCHTDMIPIGIADYTETSK